MRNIMLSLTIHPANDPAPGTPPLLIAHGLFGSGRNWGVIARRLADRRDVIAVDMRNHGESPRQPTHSYPELAADLAEVIAAHGGRADVLGHSMGGKAAMQLALTQAALVRKLIVSDIAPVAYGHDQTRHIDAMRTLLDLGSWHVAAVAIRPEQRRRHLGGRLLTATFAQAREQGFERVSLHVWTANTTALGLYLRLGFTETGSTRVPPHTLLRHGDSLLALSKVL
jgi:pimeloyl-ACP methyl ester carboxylesterase